METCYHCLLNGKITKPTVLISSDGVYIPICNECQKELAKLENDSKTEYRTRVLKSDIVGKEMNRK